MKMFSFVQTIAKISYSPMSSGSLVLITKKSPLTQKAKNFENQIILSFPHPVVILDPICVLCHFEAFLHAFLVLISPRSKSM